MSYMIAAVLVDTNVFLYARDLSEPSKQPRASQWLDYLWREQLGRTSVQVLSEYYFNATHKLKPGLRPDEAWDDVRALFSWNPQAIDAEVLSRARETEQRYRLSWWDSLVVAAAQLQGCALLLSEDLQDGAVYGGVTVRSPFTLGVSEAVTEYANVPVPTRRYRGRGRPRLAGYPVG